jgi:hypothetical protein
MGLPRVKPHPRWAKNMKPPLRTDLSSPCSVALAVFLHRSLTQARWTDRAVSGQSLCQRETGMRVKHLGPSHVYARYVRYRERHLEAQTTSCRLCNQSFHQTYLSLFWRSFHSEQDMHRLQLDEYKSHANRAWSLSTDF